MIFAQFYQNSTGYVSGSIPPRFDPTHVSLIPATGDRSVAIIDARLKKESIGQIAADECKKRGYLAWQIFKGDSFTACRAISGRWPVAGRVDNSAQSGTWGA